MKVTYDSRIETVIVEDIAPPIVIPPVEPPTALPVITTEPMINTMLVALNGWCGTNGGYERFQNLDAKNAAPDHPAFGCKAAQPTRMLKGPTYTLNLYAKPEDTVPLRSWTKTLTTAVQTSLFDSDYTGLKKGWYRVRITTPAGESSPSWFIYVRGSISDPAPTTMPVVSGSYDLMHSAQPGRWAMVPAEFKPKIKPLPVRTHAPWPANWTPSMLYREYLAPFKGDMDILRPHFTEGVLNTFNFQAYAYSTLTAQLPGFPLYDGPRGRGTSGMVTQIRPSNRLDSRANYFLQPWRFCREEGDGTITTQAGWMHDDTGNLVLVGDWTRVTGPKGMWEAWGECTDPDSEVLDPNAPPIGNEQPHLSGVRRYIADTRHNRVLLLTYSPTDRTVPAIVTEFITGLPDVFDVECQSNAQGGNLYVSVRGLDEIRAYDKNTGAFRLTVVKGASLGKVDVNRHVAANAGVTLTQIQAQPCCLPEGLDLQDGTLQFASTLMRQIKEINLSTGVIRVVGTINIQSTREFFCKIARSDGTTLPRGTTLYANWNNAAFGAPFGFLPDGTHITIQNLFAGDKAISQGRGGYYEAIGYSTAVGLGNNRVLFSSSIDAICQTTLAQPTDPTIDYAKYMRGRDEYMSKGYFLTHSLHNFPYQNLADPAGTADLAYYIAAGY